MPITYLTTPNQEFLLNRLSTASVHFFVNRAGARIRKPKNNKKRGIAPAKNAIIIALNQVSVTLTSEKNNTKLTR
jgi:hypothetical protein